MENKRKSEHRFYRIALKIEFVFIVFLLACIVLVARCSPEPRHQKATPPERTLLMSKTPFPGSNHAPQNDSSIQADSGLASYYQNAFQGHPTASGERYNPNELTAAHKFYPFGTLIHVTNLDNGKQVTVRINDRGPHQADRVIDLSNKAAEILGIIDAGTANVKLEPL